jgi:para-nitrobenzyl esterase
MVFGPPPTRDQVEHVVGAGGWRAAATPTDVLVDAMTERFFAAPAHAFARAVAAAGGAVWVYRFDWAPAGSPLGACHCLELPLVFGTGDAWAGAPMIAGADRAQQDALSALIRRCWLSFARDGAPAGGLPWPRYDRHHPTMIFNARSGTRKERA